MPLPADVVINTKALASKINEIIAALGTVKLMVRKAADQTVSDSVVLVNDNHLLFAVAANEVWEFTILMLVTTSAVADFKGAIVVPNLASISWYSAGFWNTDFRVATETVSGTSSMLKDGPVTGELVIIKGIVINGANAGNVQLQWAQNVAEATDTKVLENSCIIAHQLA